MSKLRTFVAIEIPNNVKEQIAAVQSELKRHGDRVSWVKSTNIHLTLKFLGDVEESLIDSIGKKIQTAAEKSAPFSGEIAELGAFPNLRRARVLWAGVNGAEIELTDLVRNLENELKDIGFPKEKRKFNPHMTIGRVKSPLSPHFIARIKQLEFNAGVLEGREIVFMRSDLKPTGAVYIPLSKARLRAKS